MMECENMKPFPIKCWQHSILESMRCCPPDHGANWEVWLTVAASIREKIYVFSTSLEKIKIQTTKCGFY
jgi:hypothetical protein